MFNGCNDIVYKKYALKVRSRGMMIAGIGMVWGLWQYAYSEAYRGGLSTDPPTAVFGLLCGAILVLANILYLECLAHLNASLGSTIYRLNTIGVVILSCLFLGESLGAYKLVAIVLGIVAVLMLYRPDHGQPVTRVFVSFLFLIILAALLRATYSVLAKYATGQGADILGMIPYTALCWVIGGLGYALAREQAIRVTAKLAVYAFASGTLIFLTVTTLMLAIRLGEVSTLIPIANCSFIVVLILSGLLKLEVVTSRKVLAIALAAGSILMLSRL